MFKLRITLFAVLIFSTISSINAADKIGVVNMQKIFSNYYKTKLADANMKKQEEVYQDYAEQLERSKKKLKKEFIKLRDKSQNVSLNKNERKTKQLEAKQKHKQLRAKEAEILQYQQEKQLELRQKYKNTRDAILKDIKNEIRRRAVLEGYSIVMDTSGRTFNNLEAVFYYEKSMDITDDILKALNRGQKIDKKNKKTKILKNNN